MIRCPFCGIAWVDNTVFCEECGHYLLEVENRRTDPLEIDETDTLSIRVGSVVSYPQNADPIAIRLKMCQSNRKMEIPLSKIIYLGRVDPGADVFPDIDLSEHAPAQNISRRHASISKQNGKVLVEDVGSTNGTFINGKRLDAFLPEVLHSGDILCLGMLQIEVELLMD